MRMGMNWAELLLLALTAWTLVGALGITLSFLRREREQALRHLSWVAGVWLVYLAVVLGVSLLARPRVVALGQDQCFGSLCFAVVRTEAMPSYLASHGERALRVSIQITNHSRDHRQGDSDLKAYLVDSRSRRWFEVPGLGGVRLSTTVGPENSIISEPIFKVASDATELRLVFTHGHGLSHVLRIGDRDSLLHPLVFAGLGL